MQTVVNNTDASEILQELAESPFVRNRQRTDPSSTATTDISVIIPVYNGEHYIAAAIRSVLAQTLQPCEIIVIDDGSTDNTINILKTFGSRLTVLRQTRQGHCAARNLAAGIAKGTWLAMLDADDLWNPSKLELQAAQQHGADVLYTGTLNFQNSQRVNDVSFLQQQCHSGDVFERLILDNFITHSSVMIRTKSLLQVGGYDVSLKTTGDWDLWLRLAAAGYVFRGHRQPLTSYRWHAQSNSRNHHQTCKDRLRILSRVLSTERAQSLTYLCRAKAIARAWQTSAWFVSERDDQTALLWYLRSIRSRPFSIRGWKEIFRCCAHLCGISRQNNRVRRKIV